MRTRSWTKKQKDAAEVFGDRKLGDKRSLKDGELEIGQVSGMLDEILPAGEIVSQIIKEFQIAQRQLTDFKL